MKRLAIQFIAGRRPHGVDEEDLVWQTINGPTFPLSERERAWREAEAYDADFDHRFTHRVAEVEIDDAPPPPRPLVKAPSRPPAAPSAPLPALEGQPKPARRAGGVKPQLARHRLEAAFRDNVDRYRAALAAGQTDALEPLLDLLERDLDGYLELSGGTLLAQSFRGVLAELREAARGEQRPALRVVR